MRTRCCGLLWAAVLFLVAGNAAVVLGQVSPAANTAYSRRNTFGFLASYSNDSSHILMGISEDRKLLSFGGVYNRRLLQNRTVNWQYSAEVFPLVIVSEPVVHEVVTYSSPISATDTSDQTTLSACRPGSGSVSQTIGDLTYSYTFVDTCKRQQTVGEAMSPVGFQWNFLPRHKLQPFLVGHGGYLYTTRPIPDPYAGSFNFTFDGGAGLELFRTRTRSVRLEIRFHHISNDNTARDNPGIDNAVFQVSYAFGH